MNKSKDDEAFEIDKDDFLNKTQEEWKPLWKKYSNVFLSNDPELYFSVLSFGKKCYEKGLAESKKKGENDNEP